MDRELAMEVVRVTEAAALAASQWMGKGKKIEADDAATQAMRYMFDSINMKGKVVIGEGEMDEAPMLYIGEKLGNGWGQEMDIAVDPLEGTTLLSKGHPNAMSILAIADKGTLLHAPDMYMEKLVVGKEAAGKVSLDDSIEHIIDVVAEAKSKRVQDVIVILLEREHHQDIIDRVREKGARVQLMSNCDVAAAIAAALPHTGIDIFIGRGGAPEGVITAAAIKALEGDMQARLVPMDDAEEQRCLDMGLENPRQLLLLDDLVKDDAIFAATGITSGELLDGVTILGSDVAETTSIVTRVKTKTIRYIKAQHRLSSKEYLNTTAPLNETVSTK